MEVKERKKCLMQGSIGPDFIARSVKSHQSKNEIGAHSLFLGQVRADTAGGKTTVAIEYSAYDEMAEARFFEIREAAFARYTLSCLHIYHSLGRVKAGEVSLFVMVSSPHRRAALEAMEYIVEEIKISVPVWKREIYDDGTHGWAENTKTESK